MFIRETEAGPEQVRLSSFDDRVAMEKGRLMAAKVCAHDAEKRREVEERYGAEYIRQLYPEAYQAQNSTAFGRFLEKVKLLFGD
jgi:hypothetical protein